MPRAPEPASTGPASTEPDPTGPAAPRPAGAPRRPPSVEFLCPRCEAHSLWAADRASPGSDLACASCGLGLGEGDGVGTPTCPVERCWICGNEEFYLQKDFNRELGLMIVAFSFLIVFLVMLLVDHRVGVFCLFGLALADWLAYRRLATVTVCYLCHSVYRGFPLNPKHGGFYLANEERFKHVRGEWLKSFPSPRG